MRRLICAAWEHDAAKRPSAEAMRVKLETCVLQGWHYLATAGVSRMVDHGRNRTRGGWQKCVALMTRFRA